MKANLVLTTLLLSLTGFAQVESLKKLKENTDLGKQKMRQLAKSTSQDINKTLYVNPFVGTGGHGHTFPGASMPFGFMQLSPDTRYDGWDGCGGYHYSDSVIYGFSHTHLSGTGVSDYADLLIVPQQGKPKWLGKFEEPDGYGHPFSHDDEIARPGYYSVNLKESGIKVELATDVHSGMHRYEFADDKAKKFILIDLEYRDELLDYQIELVHSKKITGKRISKSWAEEQHYYFTLEASVPIKNIEFNQDKTKAMLEFDKSSKVILLKVGQSAVDISGAENNLAKEIPHWSLPAVRAKANSTWEKELSKIEYEGLDRNENQIFYTALYHSFLCPNEFSDFDGRYRGLDKQIHQLEPGKKQYTVFSLWDTYRGLHPLFTLTQQERMSDLLESLLRMGEQGGDLPVWELAGNETECMIGFHSVSVLADAASKGFEFDYKKALELALQTSQAKDFSKDQWTKNGFLSLDKEPESVSKALEYAYDDYCIALLAKKSGKINTYKEYLSRSLNWVNHYNPESKFFQARREGLWQGNFVPNEVNFNFTEANAWQYSMYTPHAIDLLIKLHGGEDAFEKRLDELFKASSETSGRNQADITGLIGQYAHGNEPSHHVAYLYNRVNQPYKTQDYIDQIQTTFYQNLPDGLSGNEDCGQMSAWYVLSAIGFYPVTPGEPVYDIGRPRMRSANLKIGNKTTFITSTNNSKSNKYIQSVKLNSKEIDRSYLHHDEIQNGDSIEFIMGPTPNPNLSNLQKAWSIKEMTKDFIPLPHFVSSKRVFDDSLRIEIGLPYLDSRFTTQYKIDNSDWQYYKDPFWIFESCILSIRTIDEKSNQASATLKNQFSKRNKGIQLVLHSEYANQYAAGGDYALIDGLKGSDEFRTGDWQGYYNQDLVADIVLESEIEFAELKLGLIEDLKSWIFYPEQVMVSVSADGKKYSEVSRYTFEEASNYRSANHKRIAFKLEADSPFKYIRIQAKKVDECPEWHLGKGNPTWIFADEIEVLPLKGM